MVLAIAGKVEVSKTGATLWTPAQTNLALAAGDRLRTGERSRATVRLADLSILRLTESTTIEIGEAPGAKASLKVNSGSTYLHSRQNPRDLFLETPVVSGAIRGTEFNLAVAEDGRTVLTLLEGEVTLQNNRGAIELKSGDQGIVEPGQAPHKTAMLEALNVIQWTLYYPGVIDPDELPFSAAEKNELAESLAEYRRGDLLAALARYPAKRNPVSTAEEIYLAALLLSVGDVARAEPLLTEVRENETARSLAAALNQLIAAVKNQSWTRPSPPKLSSEWMAESYHQQSRSKLEAALSAARAAAIKSPAFGFAWARVAELEFSFGNNRAALAALDNALRLSPRHAQALSLKGFVLLEQNRVGEAKMFFNQAIAVDGSLANAWLGRGLARIREGEATAGRDDLQVASALEPNRAVLRSYLGKAFGYLGDDMRAAKELALSKKLDAADPTSWLYSALVNQQNNRINAAVRDLEKSQELNDNRGIYRSRLLLDQDRAVRSANLAQIYQDAGLLEVSVREAARAVQNDYANYSAHLFLADSYNRLRDPKQINLRYETVTVNEYLLANLLAPPGVGAISSTLSPQNYARLFERDGLRLASETHYYGGGDWIQSSSIFGNFGGSSFSLDSHYRGENGQRANNEQEQVYLAAQFKQQLTPQDSAYLQVIDYTIDSGDLAQYYNQGSAIQNFRTRERQEPQILFGYHHEWAPGLHTIFLAGRLTDVSSVDSPQWQNLLGTVAGGNYTPLAVLQSHETYHGELEIYTAELQQIFQTEKNTVVAGIRYQNGEFETRSHQDNPSVAPFLFPVGEIAQQDFAAGFERVSFYGYDNWRLASSLLVSAGLSYDRVDYPQNFRYPPINPREESRERISPKAGLIWTPLKDTRVRASYTRSLGGASIDQSFRLEPTQVAGFNQTYRSLIPESVAGAISSPVFETYGLGLDHRFGCGTYFGIEGELLNSDVSRIFGAYAARFAPPSANPVDLREHLNYHEKSLIVNINQLLGDEWSIGARYRLSNANLDDRTDHLANSIFENEATLHEANFFALFNHPSGFFARADTYWVSQSNTKTVTPLPGDDFWQFSVYLGYRFSRRQAEVGVGLLNITGTDYRLNPLNWYTELPRERTLAAHLKFTF
jgi:Tfp pilus assembly protein PilF